MKTNKKKQTLHAALLAACALTAVAFPVNNAFASVRFDGDTLYLNPYWSLNTEGKAEEHDMLYGNGTVYTDTETGDKKELSEFKNIVITINQTDYEATRGNYPWSFKFDGEDTKVVVHIEGNKSNSDGIHLTNWNPHFTTDTYEAYIDAPISDAINMSHDATTGYVTINHLKAEVKQGHGIRANAPTRAGETNTLTINESADITIYDDGYSAVWAGDSQRTLLGGSKTEGKGEVYLNGITEISLNNEDEYGIHAGKNGSIEVNDLKLMTSGEAKNSYGVAAHNSNSTYGTSTILDNSPNIHGTSILMTGDTYEITMNGADSYAVYASGVDDQEEQQQNSVKSGENGIGTIDFTGDVMAESGGLIDLHVTGEALNLLEGDVKAYGTEKEKNAAVNLTVDNALAGEGTIAAADGGTVNLSLGAYSNWTGRADDYQDAAADSQWGDSHADTIDNAFGDDKEISSSGTVNLFLGENATWNVTGQSWVTNLNGDNSFISFIGQENENPGSHALHIDKLTGTNTFVMDVRPGETGDMLYVKDGSQAGTQNLIINNRDEVLRDMAEGEKIRFATVQNAGGGFNEGDVNVASGAFGKSTRIAGAGVFNVDFDIEYHKYGDDVEGDKAGEDAETANDVYNGGGFSADKPGSDYVENNYGVSDNVSGQSLLAEEDDVSDTNDLDGTQNVYIVRKDNTMDDLSNGGKTVIAMSKVNYSNAVYMDRLNKRMGEARFLEGDDGLWVRLRHDRIGKSDAFRSKNTMFEIGYDWKDEAQKDGTHYRGFAFDYMRGTADYTNVLGEGDVRRAGLWYHDTWMGDKGHYTDYVVKYGRLSNDFDIYGRTTGEKISGDYDNDVWSVSAEYGRKKDLGNDWYIEPQAQLQYAYVTDASYTTSQGTKVSLDSIDSLIGRAGFRLGRDTDEANTVYFKADILHEFLGGQSIRAMDSTGTLSTTYENEGTWYDVGFGFSHRMSKDKYMFLDVEKLFGNDNEDTYQVNIGLNMAF